MALPRRVAVLHDSPDFGGHERAFMTWLPELLACEDVASVDVWAPKANAALLAALAPQEGQKLRITRHPFLKERAEPLRAPFRRRYAGAVRRFVGDTGADLTLLLQGRIENLAVPMLALSHCTELVSYIPMAHSAVEMERGGVAGRLIDLSKRPYYAKPRRWIVPAKSIGRQLRCAGATAPIHVVDNVPANETPLLTDARGARAALGLKPNDRVALFMGRFDMAQKGLDRLLRDISAAEGRLVDWTFLFVGAGPGDGELRAFGQRHSNVRVMAWTERPEDVLAAADVVLLPSRYEGVPLILLEAIQAGVPVLASEIDVFIEYLPAMYRRDFSRPVDLMQAIVEITSSSSRRLFHVHAAGIGDRLVRSRSQRAFVESLLGRSHPQLEAIGRRAATAKSGVR